MKSLYIFLCFLFSSLISFSAWADISVVGVGATFPYPLYSKWAELYDDHAGIDINYQPIGSGGGINQIDAGTVDFGASDEPLSPSELNKRALVQFPGVIGGITLIVNLPNLKSLQLRLTGSVLSEIYLGKIKTWTDHRIIELNPGIRLPNLPITVVHRSDGSGTTFLFTSYLDKVSEAWKKVVGSAAAVAWPVGIGGKGNEGVLAYVKRVKGAIGYVEYAYAIQNESTCIQMINHDGQAVSPSLRTFEAAAQNTHWDAQNQFSEMMTDEPGAESWPITGASFILMKRRSKDAESALEVLKFFDWAYKKGKTTATQMHYVPLPDELVKIVHDHWTNMIKDQNGRVIWPGQTQNLSS